MVFDVCGNSVVRCLRSLTGTRQKLPESINESLLIKITLNTINVEIPYL